MKEYPENIYIKYHFDENFIPVSIKWGKNTRGHKKINPLNSKLQSAYTSQMPGRVSKKNDMIVLVNSGVIPEICGTYYQSLPCIENIEYINELDTDYDSE